jgi:hypothetical protein
MMTELTFQIDRQWKCKIILDSLIEDIAISIVPVDSSEKNGVFEKPVFVEEIAVGPYTIADICAVLCAYQLTPPQYIHDTIEVWLCTLEEQRAKKAEP